MKQLLEALTALLKVKNHRHAGYYRSAGRAVPQRKCRAGQVPHNRNNGCCVLFWNAE